MTETLDFALRNHAAGLSQIPIKADGSKAPDTASWKRYQEVRASESDLRGWFDECVERGIAVLGGPISDNLECIDVDAPELVKPFREAVEAAQPGLLAKITHNETPRPGGHFIYRCSGVEIPGNHVLARTEPRPMFDKVTGKPKIDERTGKQKLAPVGLIETRGRGGYFLVEGSPGACHPTGRTYRHAGGPPLHEVQEITPEEREVLHRVARQFNLFVDGKDGGETAEDRRPRSGPLRPGDDFNQRATWDEILSPHGWRRDKVVGGLVHWTRPDKDAGTSATTGAVSAARNELLCCFSTNAYPFEGANGSKPCTSYTKFYVFALLNHGGDLDEAAKALGAAGYGEKPAVPQSKAGDGHHLTDLGNARRLVDRHGKDFRYCFPWKSFLVWNGVYWQVDNTGAIERLAKDTVKHLWTDAARAEDADDRKRLMHFAAASEKRDRIQSMIALAKSEPGIPILPESLDQDGFSLCCPNCVVDLRTGKQRPHRREDYITRLCPTRFNPDAPSYAWDRFVDSIFDGKQSLIDFARRLSGYAISGDVSEQIVTIAQGGGSNGKSTWLNALLSTLGPDFSMQAMAELLMAKKQAQHSTERADLCGMRLVCCAESGDGKPLDEAFVKQLSGGDKIRARKCFKDNTEFGATFKVVLCTNHKPIIKGTDHGIWRRIVLLPFVVRFWDGDKGEDGPEELRIDKSLPKKLEAEAEGILAWRVRGCVEWQQHGLQIPLEVRDATGQYRTDQDRVGQFIAEQCITGSMVRVRASSLYGDYRNWSEQRGECPVSLTKFGEAITERGFEKRMSNGIWYLGIGTRSETPV
jgi:P4 family phage/plasmid primase-like protien